MTNEEIAQACVMLPYHVYKINKQPDEALRERILHELNAAETRGYNKAQKKIMELESALTGVIHQEKEPTCKHFNHSSGECAYGPGYSPCESKCAIK